MLNGLFLYNPKSGDQSIKNRLDDLFECFQNADILLVPYRMFQTEEPSETLLKVLQENSFSFILLSGGDGSLNFILNFLLKNKVDLPLGILPCGTCNDFARSIGMSNNPQELIPLILSGKTHWIDAGCINDHHYFLGNLSGGIFADVSFNTPNELKKSLGPAAYYLKALDALPAIEAFDIVVDTNDCHLEEKIILFLVLNGKNVAGFSDFFQKADPEDALIDILLFKNAKPMEMAGIFMKTRAGGLPDDRHIIHLRAKEVRLQADRAVQICVDGEKGTILPIKVECIHPGIRLFINHT